MTDVYYTIRRLDKDKIEVARFGDEKTGRDGKSPRNIFDVMDYSNGLRCTCLGWRWQKDKSQHQHCKMVKFWKENLNEESGYCLWWDGEDLEFNRFINDADVLTLQT